jgi:GT2 family glycosyltransferase
VVTSTRTFRAIATAATAASIGAALLTAANSRALRRPKRGSYTDANIAVLIPARDEQESIANCVSDVLAQVGVPNMQVIVLDDGSTDDTAAILDSFDDPRLQVLHAPDAEPPAGWLGKAWACSRLATYAEADVLVFVDADVRLTPDAIAGSVQHLIDNNMDLISPYPQQLAEGFAERVVQPLVTWSWMATVPLRWARSNSRASLAAANGQFLIVRASTYQAIGGHQSVAGDVLEDVGLMRSVRHAGGRTETMSGAQVAQCRMYHGWSEVEAGYAKSLWSAFGSPAAAAGVNLALVVTFISPALALTSNSARTRHIGAIGYTAAVASRVLAARSTGSRTLPDALLHPLSIAAFAGLNVVSWQRHVRGKNQWKGRSV